MDQAGDLVRGVLAAIAYTGLGLALVLLGFEVVDWLTPGKLRKQIWEDNDINAAILAVSAMIGIGIVVVTSIFVAHADVGEGLIDTAVFGLLGLVLFAIAFKVTDWLTPGNLGELMVEERFHPAVLLSAATNVVIGLVLAVSIIP
jgi:uncharacterized membrane protein YjfL (UPF0719 family)